MGIFCRNSPKTWELQFGAQVGIAAGLLMGTASPGGAQHLGNVGLAHPECSFKGTLGLSMGQSVTGWIHLPGGSSRLIPGGFSHSINSRNLPLQVPALSRCFPDFHIPAFPPLSWLQRKLNFCFTSFPIILKSWESILGLDHPIPAVSFTGNNVLGMGRDSAS